MKRLVQCSLLLSLGLVLLVADTPVTPPSPMTGVVSAWFEDATHTLEGWMRAFAKDADKPVARPLPPAPSAVSPVALPPRTLTSVLAYVAPFTGQPSMMEHSQRPIVIMIENSYRARPQSGLHKADLVYEVLAEGNITRFVAVFHSQRPDVVGPVRSIRPYLVALGAGVDGLIVHAGWSQDAMNVIHQRQLDHLDQVYGDHRYYWRDKTRRAPHNLYTSVLRIEEAFADKGIRTQWNRPTLLRFLDPSVASSFSMPIDATPAKEVAIPYLARYVVGYRYDDETKEYARWMNNEPHRDKTTHIPITAKNVLVVEAPHRILDEVGRREVDIDTPGKGYLLQEGMRYAVYWKFHEGIMRAYAHVDMEEPLPLFPGTTWIQIVQNLEKVTFPGENVQKDRADPHREGDIPLGVSS